MPITMTERPDSREKSKDRTTLRFDVRGTASDTEAELVFLSLAPATYDGRVCVDHRLESVWADTVTMDGHWIGEVVYGDPEEAEPETGDSTYSFDTGGGTQKLTQSLQTISKTAPAGETAPDFKGAIGVTDDSVEGVDITVPVYRFSETHYIDAASVTPEYKAKLFALTGKTNSGTFRGLAAGECLFLGASGSIRDSEKWEVTFNFAASPNKTNIAVGDITVPAKKGWEYLWVRYADAKDGAAKRVVKVPIAAYVEKVYEAGDFADLGIGTG